MITPSFNQEANENHEFCVHDVCSMYPYIMLESEFPVGEPKV